MELVSPRIDGSLTSPHTPVPSAAEGRHVSIAAAVLTTRWRTSKDWVDDACPLVGGEPPARSHRVTRRRSLPPTLRARAEATRVTICASTPVASGVCGTRIQLATHNCFCFVLHVSFFVRCQDYFPLKGEVPRTSR